MTTEELRIVITASGTSAYTTQMQQVTASTNNFGNSIANAMSILKKIISAGLIAKFAKDCVNAASDLQEVANVTDVTFGAMADTVNEWAKSQAINFGLSETAAKRYIGNFGTMAKQFGMATDEAAKMGIELTKLTGDVASFYNIDNSVAYTKLKSVFTGETESLKELGVVMTETQLNAYAMEKGFGKQVSAMSESEKTLLRYSFVTEKLSHANGDFARTSDGYANSVRTLSLQLENLKVEIGSNLIPVVSYGLQLINKGIQFVSPILISVAETVKYYSQAWQNASEQIKNFVKISLGIVAVGVIAPKIAAVVSTAIKVLSIEITTLTGALNALFAIASIGLMAVAFSDLKESVNEMKASKTNDDLKALADTSTKSAEAVDTLAESVDSLSDSAKSLDVFLASFDEVNKVGGNKSLMSNVVNSDDLKNIMLANTGLDDMSSILSGVNDSLANLGNISDPFAKLKEFFIGYTDYMSNWFSSGQFKTDISSMFTGVYSWLGRKFPKWTKFWTNVGEKVFDTVEATKGYFNNMKENTKEIYQWFESKFPRWTSFWEGVGGTVFDIVETIKSYFTDMKNAIKSVFDDIKNLFSNVTDGFKTAYETITGKSLATTSNGGNSYTYDAPRITGGVTASNGTASQKITSAATSMLENVIAFTPTINIDGKAITSTIVDKINSMTRSSGKSPLIELG